MSIAEDYIPWGSLFEEECNEPPPRSRYWGPPPRKTCAFCGIGGLHWDYVGGHQYRLFTACGTQHVCPAVRVRPEDFPIVEMTCDPSQVASADAALRSP